MVNINISLPNYLHEELKILAIRNKQPLKVFIKESLIDVINRGQVN